MAHIFQTTMSPTKTELLAAWLPTQPWFVGDAAALTMVGAYRFDDPEGEVGIEGHLFTAGDETVYHVPLTYRGAELDGGADWLLGTSAHGVLGTRWITAGIGDPVFRSVVTEAIAQGHNGVREYVETADGVVTEREPSVRVRGSGALDSDVPELWAAKVSAQGLASVADTGLASLAVQHVVELNARPGNDPVGTHTLRGEWDAHPAGVVLVSLLV